MKSLNGTSLILAGFAAALAAAPHVEGFDPARRGRGGERGDTAERRREATAIP